MKSRRKYVPAENTKFPRTVRRRESEKTSLFYQQLRLPFGKERRVVLVKLIKACADAGYDMGVNRRGCLQLKRDKDLQKMLKKGVIETYRSGEFKCKTTRVRLT